jgi:serine/threonine protein kinase/Tol biopolymer transport system component
LIGRTISHYEVLEKLGEGGMGVVYKARDTQLNRLVALKALPADTAADPERRARFLQEAQAASALNHPGIVTIHDVLKDEEGDVIVMELVPGRTLDELIPRKGMPLAEALKLAIQMASALEAAHDAGIVHRDFKPGNVMVSDDGRVRVLDFGLAKLSPVAREERDGSGTRATEAAPRTRDGQVLGTVSYMSPEQAEGRTVDARSDIFSFGAVLYEMVAGHRPFRGDSSMSTLAAVLKEEPEPLPADVPHDLEKLIERCLRKDPQRRMRHMDDVRVALEDLKQESDSGTLTRQVSVSTAGTKGRRRALGLAALVMIAIVSGVGWWSSRRSVESLPPMREIPFTADPGSETAGRFSPDGSTVVFARWPLLGDGAADFTKATLQIKMVGAEGSQLLRSGGAWPVYSPDGRWIAFEDTDGRASGTIPLFVIPHIGGRERRVAVARGFANPGRNMAWGSDDEWLITLDRDEDESPFHIALVSVQGRERHRLTTPPAGIIGDAEPALSPDGRTLAFTRHVAARASDLYLLPLGPDQRSAGEARRLTHDVPNANSPVWMPDGQEIVFCSGQMHASSLWRIRTDGESPARPLGLGGRGALWPDVDRTGTKLLYTKHVWDPNIWRVELLPSGLAAGAPEAVIRSTQVDTSAAFSPDGRNIAFASERSGSGEIWLANADGGAPRPLTSLGVDDIWNSTPVWSPDGEWIAFAARIAGNQDVYVVPAEGGVPRRLTTDPAGDWVLGWSADGHWVHVDSDRDGKSGPWRVPREAGEREVEKAPWGGLDPEAPFRYFPEWTETAVLLKREPMGGGAVETIAEAAWDSFAVTRRGVYFPVGNRWVPTHIAFLDLATRRQTKVVDLRPASYSGQGLSLSPDGRSLLYTQCDQETDDLMLVENFR